MSDKTFEISIITLTIVVILGIIAGICLHLNLALIIVGALVLELGVSTLLLHLWGRSYMSRM